MYAYWSWSMCRDWWVLIKVSHFVFSTFFSCFLKDLASSSSLWWGFWIRKFTFSSFEEASLSVAVDSLKKKKKLYLWMDLNFNYFCSIIVQKKRKKNLLVNLECAKKRAVKYRDGSLPICCRLWVFFAVVSAYQRRRTVFWFWFWFWFWFPALWKWSWVLSLVWFC